MVLLFVYGSLMKGMWNNFWLQNAIFYGKADTVEKFSLCTTNHVIPKIYREENYIITGELYDISEKDLVKLDSHEGYEEGRNDQSYYVREKIEVKIGKIISEAFVYIGNFRENEEIHVGHGDYKKYINSIPGTENFVRFP